MVHPTVISYRYRSTSSWYFIKVLIYKKRQGSAIRRSRLRVRLFVDSCPGALRCARLRPLRFYGCSSSFRFSSSLAERQKAFCYPQLLLGLQLDSLKIFSYSKRVHNSNVVNNNAPAVNNFSCKKVKTTITPAKRGGEEILEGGDKHQKISDDPFNNKEVNADEEDEEETDENDEVYVDEDEEEETDDNEEDEIEDDDVPLDIEKNLIINDINISVKINECVRASSHIDKLENQDLLCCFILTSTDLLQQIYQNVLYIIVLIDIFSLLRYNIIDNTPDSSFYVKDLLGKEWELFSASLVQYYSLYNDVSRIKNKVDTITFNCRTLSSLLVSYKEKKAAIKLQSCPDIKQALKFIKIFTALKIRNKNHVTDKRQTEMGYIILYLFY